eukprot:m.27692 g.27692  ORF g.27692 m.27692 type:complete len:124 (+) comp30278_c0_seq1:81-452(+)
MEEVDIETKQRLKAAIHYTVGKICEQLASNWDEEMTFHFTPQFVATLAEATFRQCETLALDLESFAKHAKRTVVKMDDVKICARRNGSLHRHIASMAQRLASEQEEDRAEKKAKRKKKIEIDD